MGITDKNKQRKHIPHSHLTIVLNEENQGISGDERGRAAELHAGVSIWTKERQTNGQRHVQKGEENGCTIEFFCLFYKSHVYGLHSASRAYRSMSF